MEKSLNTMSKHIDFIDTTTGEVFTYAALSREDEAAAREDAAIIKTNLRSAAESVITVGQALIRQKSRLPHGMFLPWIEAEFGMSRHSAERFMLVSDAYSQNAHTVRNLNSTALYELAAPSTPPEIRDRVEEMIVDGEKVTAAQIKRMKAEAKAAREEAERLRIEAEKPKPAFQIIDMEAVKAQAQAEVRSQVATEVEEHHDTVHALRQEIGRLQSEIKTLSQSAPAPADTADGNVVRPAFNNGTDDFYDEDLDDGVRNERDAVKTFVGSLKSMTSLSFSPSAFLAYADPKKENGRDIRDALFSANSTISNLLKEMSKNV